jgi:uncharacterized protein (TIGR03437 family)
MAYALKAWTLAMCWGAMAGMLPAQGQHTAGVLSRVGIENYPIGCTSSQGNPTDQNPWANAAGSSRCSVATQADNIDGLVVLVNWKTLQPNAYTDPLNSYYIDNAIYSMAHPERQSIRLGVLTGTHSPNWLVNPPSGAGATFPNTFGSGTCNPSAGGPTTSGPGTIWNVFSMNGTQRNMPNPFGTNSCLFTALDNLLNKMGQTGDYNMPAKLPFPPSLAPYDTLYYDSAPGSPGFVHTASPTSTMNKIVGHVSVLGPSSYDDESVLCQVEADCQNLTDNPNNTYNYSLWRSLMPSDAAMETSIEAAQKQTIDIFAKRYPSTYWTIDLVERQMPFFNANRQGCMVPGNPYPPTSSGPDANDASDCFGELRTNLIAYIQAKYPLHGGVQNNSLGAGPNQIASQPVLQQTALAAQAPPLNSVQLFAGLEVAQPGSFYLSGDSTFAQFQNDAQTAVNLAKHMLSTYSPVNFIEFYDVDIANRYTLSALDGSISTGSLYVNQPSSVNNDDPGGFLYAPLTDAHTVLRGNAQTAPPAISLVANAEGESPTIAPNTWVEVKGSNLAPAGDTRVWQTSDFVGDKLPTSLDGVSVTVNGQPAYVYYISPTQINILTPPNAMSGAVQVIVTANGSTSAAYTVLAQPTSPSFFVINGGPYVVAQHAANYALVGPASLYPGTTTPAKPGETVVLYANGFGQTTTPVASGSETQSGNLSPLPSVTIGGIAASVSYAALVSPGLFQFNVVVPANAPSGDNQLVATVNGVATFPVDLLTIQSSAPATTANFYVAPNGSDTWSGSLASPNPAGTDGPFATFDRARAAVAALNKGSLTQVTVQFRGGTYYLPATEQFSAADSGTANTAIVYTNYTNESPVFSGGMRLQGWTNVSGNTWTLTLPASAQYFENLFYNGARRLRPRPGSALGTFYRIAATVYLPASATNCTVNIAGLGYECFDRFQYNPADPIAGTWKNLAPAAGNPCNQPAGNPALAGDIEVLDFEQFSTSKLRISCVDTVNHIVYLTGPTPISQNNPGQVGFIAGNRYLVDNVQNDLTQPGQWFLDRSTTPWTLTYLANSGENPNNDIVIAPQLPQLLVASGLEHVTFHGLTFEHDNYTLPAAGHPSAELEADIPGALSFQNSQHITFDSGIVTEISGTGLEFISCVSNGSPAYCASTNASAATSNDVIENSAFYDIGALAVRIGDPYVAAFTDANEPQSMTVENNVVEGYGRTIPASFGIGQGEGHDNLYTHNDVYDGYHCGISISEQAPDTIKPAGMGNANNTISYNHVWNLLQGIMNDGGSIRIEAGNNAYTAPGNKILNNRIHDVTDASIQDSNGYGGDGIYLDNQTGLVDVENNLVYRVSGFPVYTPQGPAAPNEANIIKNNILAYGRQAMVAVNFPYPYGVPSSANQVFVLTNNLFYFDRSTASSPKFYVQGGCTYSAGFPYTQFQEWNSNLYWRTDGAFATDAKAFYVQPNPVPTGGDAPCSGLPAQWTFYTFAAWQTTVGEDAQSVVENPGFNNPVFPADDYTLPKGSPGVGFVVFDYTQAGRSNPVLNPPPVPATLITMTYNPLTDY